jgi:hypothetical protein
MEEYPSEETLTRIHDWTPEKWTKEEFHKFMAFVHDNWKYANDGYWEQDHNHYAIHTAGWSGNEDIVLAMQGNYIFWSLFWQSHTRGGHFTFESL